MPSLQGLRENGFSEPIVHGEGPRRDPESGPEHGSALDKGSGEGGLSPRSPGDPMGWGKRGRVCRGSRWCLSYKSVIVRSS